MVVTQINTSQQGKGKVSVYFQPDGSGNRKNESVTVVMPLLRGEDEQEGMSSL